MIIHLVILIGLIICNFAGTVHFIGQLTSATEVKAKIELVLNVIMMLMIMFMLFTGVLYWLREYRKTAAFYYKSFLLLQVAVTFLDVIIPIIFVQMDPLLIGKSIMYAVKIVILLCLALWKDLGKVRTWILYYILVLMDIGALAMTVMHMVNTSFDFSIVGAITALIADSTTGFAIRGKFRDKESRGRK